jgi:hypothetical protein
LLEIILTLDTSGSLAHFLHRWQDQLNQNRNDGNDDQQLDEREGLQT